MLDDLVAEHAGPIAVGIAGILLATFCYIAGYTRRIFDEM